VAFLSCSRRILESIATAPRAPGYRGDGPFAPLAAFPSLIPRGGMRMTDTLRDACFGGGRRDTLPE